MYKGKRIAVVIPCYNEELLISSTIKSLPSLIDEIVVVNDKSRDDTLAKIKAISKSNSKISIIDHPENLGIGGSLMSGYRYILNNSKADIIGIVSGDGQCDPGVMEGMITELVENGIDYVKGNRFYNKAALKSMPGVRKIGNIIISVLTKFSTGYYSISDTQMGFGFLRRSVLEKVDFGLLRNRYDHENSFLLGLSIANAKIRDYPVPAIYGEETSTIDFWPTVFRTLRTVWVGFWQRLYYKYVVSSFHPIALFYVLGLLLFGFGTIFSLVIAYLRVFNGMSPTSGTVMASVLPLIIGMQLLLTAIIIDVNNEPRI